MFTLKSLTSVAKSNILGNVSLHTIPPISDLEIMVHLIPSWMNGISRFMCFTKYLIIQLLDVKHTDPSFVPIGAHKMSVSCSNISSECMK
jgi:hypothetical protein